MSSDMFMIYLVVKSVSITMPIKKWLVLLYSGYRGGSNGYSHYSVPLRYMNNVSIIMDKCYALHPLRNPQNRVYPVRTILHLGVGRG